MSLAMPTAVESGSAIAPAGETTTPLMRAVPDLPERLTPETEDLTIYTAILGKPPEFSEDAPEWLQPASYAIVAEESFGARLRRQIREEVFENLPDALRSTLRLTPRAENETRDGWRHAVDRVADLATRRLEDARRRLAIHTERRALPESQDERRAA